MLFLSLPRVSNTKATPLSLPARARALSHHVVTDDADPYAGNEGAVAIDVFGKTGWDGKESRRTDLRSSCGTCSGF